MENQILNETLTALQAVLKWSATLCKLQSWSNYREAFLPVPTFCFDTCRIQNALNKENYDGINIICINFFLSDIFQSQKISYSYIATFSHPALHFANAFRPNLRRLPFIAFNISLGSLEDQTSAQFIKWTILNLYLLEKCEDSQI